MSKRIGKVAILCGPGIGIVLCRCIYTRIAMIKWFLKNGECFESVCWKIWNLKNGCRAGEVESVKTHIHHLLVGPLINYHGHPETHLHPCYHESYLCGEQSGHLFLAASVLGNI